MFVARWWMAAGAAILALGLSGRAGWADDAVRGAKRVRSLQEMRNAEVVRQHWDLSCGAAAIATLLSYQLGDPVSERQVATDLLHRTDPVIVRLRLGFSLLDLKRYAESRGFAATGYGNLTLDELIGLAPAIVPIHANGFDHFVVVRGRRGNRVLLADPAFGNRTMTLDDFREAWPNRIGFIVHQPGQSQSPNRMGAPAELFAVPTTMAVRAAEARGVGGVP